MGDPWRCPVSRAAKRYRVTQYQEMSELGLAFFGSPSNRGKREKVGDKDFRWRWTARLWMVFHTGESAGLGLRMLTTELKDMSLTPTAAD